MQDGQDDFDWLVQDCSNSSALAVELLPSCNEAIDLTLIHEISDKSIVTQNKLQSSYIKIYLLII